VVFTPSINSIAEPSQAVLLLILLVLPLFILTNRQFRVIFIQIPVLVDDKRSCFLGAVVEDLFILFDLVFDVITDL
jgi:hypothetical protein